MTAAMKTQLKDVVARSAELADAFEAMFGGMAEDRILLLVAVDILALRAATREGVAVTQLHEAAPLLATAWLKAGRPSPFRAHVKLQGED